MSTARCRGTRGLVLTIVVIGALAASGPTLAATQWRYAGTASGSWLNLTNATGSPNSTCATAASAVTLNVTNFGFTIPAGSTIVKIEVALRYSTGSSAPSIQLLKGGAPAGTTRTGHTGGSGCPGTEDVFGDYYDLWDASWTAEEINAANFGVRFQPTSAPTSLDYVSVTVDYRANLWSGRRWEWGNRLPQGNALRAVWGSSPGMVWAVGDHGTILHFDGSDWRRMPSGSEDNLYAIWGTSWSNIFAVGERGTILRSNGYTWALMDNPESSQDLYGVWGTSANDVFAVGENGTILHYNGTSWQAQSANWDQYRGIWGVASNNVFVVGDWSVQHWNGTSWSAMETAGACYLRAIWGSSASDVYAASNSGIIWHYNGSAWSSTDLTDYPPLTSIWGLSSSLIYAAGEGTDVYRFDGISWAVDSSAPSGSEHFFGIWGVSGEVFVVGQVGRILHYEAGWEDMSLGTTTTLKAVWGSSTTDVFAVGWGGTLLHGYPAHWTATNITTEALNDVWGSGPFGVFAVGDNGTILRYNGVDWIPQTSGTDADLVAVSGSSPTNIYAVGRNASGGGGVILHNTTAWAWSPVSIDTCELLDASAPCPALPNLRDVWVAPDGEVFILTDESLIIHYDGVSWTHSHDLQLMNLTAYAVTGISSDVLYFLCAHETIAECLYGSSWSKFAVPSWRPMTSFWATSGGGLAVTFEDGRVMLFDGSSWIDTTTNTVNRLNGIWGDSNGALFAVGALGTLLQFVDTYATNHPPVASAGPDFSAKEGTLVFLNAGGTDQDGDSLMYHWIQRLGSPVSLDGSTSQQAIFFAPLLEGGPSYVSSFALQASDGLVSSVPDVINVQIVPHSFADVLPSNPFYACIEAIYEEGITAGCGEGNFCPDNPVTRAQMAVFLEKAMRGSTYAPPAPTGIFADVPTNHWAAAWIEQLANDQITAGCGGGNFCPDNVVTRAQMAVFLLKAEHGSTYVPPAQTGLFTDVPIGHWAGPWIEQLSRENITAGCGGGNFCPDSAVTRGQMAVFLAKTFRYGAYAYSD